MRTKNVRISLLLLTYVVIFGISVHISSVCYRRQTSPYVSLSSKNTDRKLEKQESRMIDQQLFTSFSYAYNKTHLWSMSLANENYYHIARLLPCRTIDYVYESRKESMNTCDQSTTKEFSVETTLIAQKWIFEHQNPVDCTNKKFAIINNYAWSGFGSTMHQIAWAFGTALGDDRIAVYQVPGNWVRNYSVP